MKMASVRSRRLLGAAVTVAAIGVLGLAAWMEPSSAGLGTHRQLGMPACGWIVAMDVPCPTCGMTTAFAHAANGDLISALITQPLGAALALAAAMAVFLGVYTVITGSRTASLFRGLWGRSAAWGLGLGIVGSWVYKIIMYKELLG